jgi:hypothetical protein
MQVWYQHRFVVPPESVEAMALMKIAGGCNFVGYYMYHGGSNPVGQRSYLNEHVTPKISYDFQAPLGEFGQVRDSYRALRLLHMFAYDFAHQLCPTATVLPPDNEAITPENTETLRFAARVHDSAGFLFLNNYQDHVEMQELRDLRLQLQLNGDTITLPHRGGLTVGRDVCTILPVNLDLGGVRLRYATAQLATRLEHKDELYYVFFAPEGMASEYCFAADSIAELVADSGAVEREGGMAYVTVTPGTAAQICIQTSDGRTVRVLTLSRRQALGLTKLEVWGCERLLLSDADLIMRDGLVELERSGSNDLTLALFPNAEGGLFGPDGELAGEADGIFTSYHVVLPPREPQLQVTRASDAMAAVHVPPDLFDGLADVMLTIHYRGDVGYASVDGELINDNFANGTAWEIGLRRFEERLLGQTLDLYISPLRTGNVVFSDSAMAVQQSFVGRQIAQIDSIRLVPRYRARIADRPARSG